MQASTRPKFKQGTQPSASGLDAVSRAIFEVRAGRGIDARIDGGQLYIANTGAIGVPSELVSIVAPIYSTDPAINPDFADRGEELRDYFRRVHRLIHSNGATVNTVDYPELALILGEAGPTMVLPDWRGRFTVGADEDPTPLTHSDTAYDEAMATGGYRRHGQTENNHLDHEFTLDLKHTHPITLNTATVCLDAATGDPPSCGTGDPTDVVIPTGSGTDTGDADYPGADDQIDSGDGTLTRSGTGDGNVAVVLKHWGTDTPTGGGTRLDDTDNRPPWGSAWVMIRF